MRRGNSEVTAQVLSTILYLTGSLLFVAGSVVLLWKALAG